MKSAVVKWVSGTYRFVYSIESGSLTERRHQEEIIARSAKLRAQQLTSGRWTLSVNLAKYGIERADDLLTPALRKSFGFDALDGEATDAVLLKANVAIPVRRGSHCGGCLWSHAI